MLGTQRTSAETKIGRCVVKRPGGARHSVRAATGNPSPERRARRVIVSKPGWTSYTSPHHSKIAGRSGTRVTRPSEYKVLRQARSDAPYHTSEFARYSLRRLV